MLKPHKDPYGYKKLLAYGRAEELQGECGRLTSQFPFSKTLSSLADQMDRSARSGKQNIVEGWKRNTTKEYWDFLGFSIGAIAELEEDCDDIWKGIYPDLMGIKGIMGGRGMERGEMGERGTHSSLSDSLTHFPHSSPSSLSNSQAPFVPFEIDKLKFYPLDKNLPPVVQLKLRCKELNFLLEKLQTSLLSKMEQEKTLPLKDKFKMRGNQKREDDEAEKKMLEQFGFVKLENGQIVKKEEME